MRLKIFSALMLLAVLASCTGPTATPTEAPAPTPKPRVAFAPIVADHYPNIGDELPAEGGAIDVYFDQAMDRTSVEAGFAVSPTVAGNFTWLDDATLRFIPTTELERASRYAVTIGAQAKSQLGLEMGTPFSFNADTVGFLEVTQVLPAPDTGEVAVDAAITLLFNRPVVPLGLSGDAANLPNPVMFDPLIEGTGEWLNTSIYVFHPAKAMSGSTTYTGRVKAGLTDSTGGLLKEDFVWSFTTLAPKVSKSDPFLGSLDVTLKQPILITFNQPMDRASTERAFTLIAGDDRATGSFKWDDDSTEMTFTPASNLKMAATYQAKVSTSAKSADGKTPLSEEYTFTFSTVLAPGIQNTNPANGEAIDVYNGIRIFFNSPMDPKTLDANISLLPEAKKVYTYYSDYDKSFFINFALKPSTDYTLTLGPEMADPYGNTIGNSPTVINFKTKPYDPLLQFNTRDVIGTYSAYLPTALYATYRNYYDLNFKLYKMPADEFARYSDPNNYEFRQAYSPKDADLLRAWSLNVQPFPNENAYVKLGLTEDDSPLVPGLYFIRAPGPNTFSVDHLLVVSKINLTVKTTFDEVLVWATDLQTGQPVPDLPIQILNADFLSLAGATSGKTDSDGLFRGSLAQYARGGSGGGGLASKTRYPSGAGLPNLYETIFVVAGELNQDNFSIATSQWSLGVDPWDFRQPSEYYPRIGQIYLYTDRPVYRPGQEVSFKGIVRAENDARFSLPDFGSVRIFITNDKGEEVYKEELSLGEFGTFNAKFKLADEAGTGYYNIRAFVGAPGLPSGYETNLGFSVAEYRKPEFLVNVTSEEAEVVQGATIHFNVNSQFFFGGPVSNADVNWTLLSANSFFQYTGPGYYDFGDFDYTSGEGTPFYGTFGEVIASGAGQTDAQGNLKINVPADIGKKITSQIFTLEATVTDVTNQPVSGRSSVTVHQGDFYLGIGPEEFLGQVGKPSSFNVISLDWGGEPKPAQEVTVTYYEHEWFSVQEQDEFGNNIWTWNAKDTEVFSETVTTDSKGAAKSAFTPEKGGTYKAVASAKDSGGRDIRSASYIWVASGEFVSWRQENNNRINLVPDRKAYKVGDTASILIPSPFQGETTALITVERAGFFKTEVLKLTTNSTTYQLPITSDYAPDVFISVVIIKGVDDTNPTPAFRMGLAKLSVSTEQQAIKVELTPDKTKVGPRDTVNYKVKATDYEGQPVQAEFSLGLADLAALSLAAPNSGPILDAFYSERGLAVRTAVGIALSVDQLNVATAAVKGGGGGAAEQFVEVRGDFRDTAYWNAAVVTDDKGEASVAITLPDNLTTWRLDARGVSKETLVGQNTVDIVATKDLLIRPVTPRFFIVGDKAKLSAVVNNNTGQDFEVEVSLSGSGFTLADPAKQTITVKAGDRGVVEWTATIADVAAADLTFTAIGGPYSDASKPPLGIPPDQRLPVYKYSAPETAATAGELTGQETRTELIALPRRFDASQGQLAISVDPSLAAGMTAGLEYLEHFQYECTEQTISRFLPNVLTYRALKELGLSDPALETRLKDLVSFGAQRLYSQQHADGGWGWWKTDESNPFITAYVLFGLNRAREAGFDVSAEALNRAADYLGTQIDSPKTMKNTWALNRQAFMLYALADYGQPDRSTTVQMYDERARLDTYGRAYLAMTLHTIDQADPRLKTLLSDINNSAILSATGAHWEEGRRDWWNMNTDTRSTAIVLSALARLDPQNNLNPNVVRWLMVARKANGAWETTQETAWALIGLTDWMTATGELKANYDWAVTLNGAEVKSGAANSGNLRDSVDLQVAVADLVKDQANQLVFNRGGGDGRMYYTAHLTVYQAVPEIKPLNKGIIVARQYVIKSDSCGGKDQPDCEPVTSAKVGDDIQVKLTIIAPNDLYYVIVDDPIPAGTEPVDTSLLTTSVVGQAPELNLADPLYYGWGWWWFSNTDIRDEKVSLSATYLPKGTYEYTYTLHASLAGEYNVIPPTANEFYFPEVSGRGEGMLFTVRP
jgi:uncharacterized protein YfaS (alpha-2-macroglobulin family)